MIWEIGSVAKYLVLPPLGFGWLVVIAWFLVRRRPGTARWLLFIAVCGVLVMALPMVADWMFLRLEVASGKAQFARAQAIVILGGGRGLMYDANQKVVGGYPGPFTLERVHAGVLLARQTGKPIMVTGGKPDGQDPTEGVVMREVIERDYGVRVQWVEDASRNTVENAEFSARLLLPQEIRTIILVTHAFHMRRSRLVFARAGFDVLPAPVNPGHAPNSVEFRDFLPNVQALIRSYYACNELGGIAYAWAHAALTPSRTVGN